MITITLDKRTRAEMNTGTPRLDNWTYHHVLPVRYYFTLASICGHVVGTAPSDDAVKKARGVLEAMVNNGSNLDKVRLFCDAGKIDDPGARAVAVLAHAKLCASPRWGGFAGMQPTQRCDDPGSNPELVKPMSGAAGWWGPIQVLQTQLDALVPTLPSTSDDKDMTLTVDEVRATAIVKDFAAEVERVAAMGILPFAPGDWKRCPTGVATSGADWYFGTRGAAGPAWGGSKDFDALNKVKNKQKDFMTEWNGGKSALGAVFALRTADTDPKGTPLEYDADLHDKAEKLKTVYRQINDLLVRYEPDGAYKG